MTVLAQMRLCDLIRDPRCQIRVVFREDYAQDLANHLDAGGLLPPVDGFRTRPGPAVLADGFHRLRAHELAGRKTIEVTVRPGGLREAILFAVGANARHGLRPRPEDNRKAVATLLLDPEWGRWNDRAVARRCGVDRGLVGRLREHLRELSGAFSQIDQDGVLVERGGTTYTMRFRDMTPAQQQAAVEGETAGRRAAWERQGKEAMETAERHYGNLGDPYGPVLAALQLGLRLLRALERERAAERKKAKDKVST